MVLFPLPTLAQIVPDATLPNPSRVSVEGARTRIDGGTTLGTNLFHSFEAFSIPANAEAVFENTPNIDNIISRVTGGEISRIDGLLQTQGTANFYFLNPNGIVFGENARLDVGGSFFASTAERLIFENGAEFSAANPAMEPLLTVSVPVGVQMGQIPGDVRVEGSGHHLLLDWETSALLRDDRPLGLQVPEGEMLSFVGGNIQLDGGNLTAFDGTVELAAVSGTAVNFGQLSAVDVAAASGLGSVTLSNAASIDVSGENGGAVAVLGARLAITEGSIVLSDTFGDGVGRPLMLRTTELVEVVGATPDSLADSWVVSGIFRNASPEATGTVGSIVIETGRLSLREGGSILSYTSGAGNAGNIEVRAREIEAIATTPDLFLPSRLSSRTDSSGNGGQITLEGDRLSVRHGAIISSETTAEGNGGSISIRTRDLEVVGTSPDLLPSSIFANVDTSGQGGTVDIEARDRLVIRNGAVISTLTVGSGDAGSVVVRGANVEVSGTSPDDFPSSISAEASLFSEGNGGDVTLEVDRLTISHGGSVSTQTAGSGNGGNLVVRGRDIEIFGTSRDEASISGLGADVFPGATGNGGTVLVEADRIRLYDWGTISSATFGEGNGGTVTVRANEIDLSGSDSEMGILTVIAADSPELDAVSRESLREFYGLEIAGGTGDAGTVNIRAETVRIREGAAILVESYLEGEAGNLEMKVDRLFLDGGLLSADSVMGDRANILLETGTLQLRRGSRITTNARNSATGGNIHIETDTLAALENSDITANSTNNFGGRVEIQTQGLFGIASRNALTSDSDITATSDLGIGFSGVVSLQQPDVNSTNQFLRLPEEPVDISGWILDPCSPLDAGSSFIVSGRGGLPENPLEVAIPPSLWRDLRPIPNAETSPAEASEAGNSYVSDISEFSLASREPLPWLEASGWRRTETGAIELVSPVPATDSFVTPQSCTSR
ncbi:filamentous hemagglutinin N-terminal domain-containing protein [Baaleninema sp.]|uniref:two-partner secretion domain-containing protein n=1 Tax=Baaleninema sp. TaxID=3101197 RepID=UPI003CFE9459